MCKNYEHDLKNNTGGPQIDQTSHVENMRNIWKCYYGWETYEIPSSQLRIVQGIAPVPGIHGILHVVLRKKENCFLNL